MRKTMIAMLAVGVVASLATPSFAQRTILRQDQLPPVSPEAYNRCYQLALQRGVNVSIGDYWILERFISDCLNGKIRH
jgi:hypothetical protein